MSRLQNSTIRHPDSPLAEFYGLRTNRTISQFPATSGGIAGMDMRALNAVLREVELPTTGNIAQKRERLRTYIGLSERAV